MLDQIRDAFIANGWFQSPGAYILVDGQFGSTGKGALAALIAAVLGDQIDVVTTNAGCNSGHTGYLRKLTVNEGYAERQRSNARLSVHQDKHVTRQVPIAGVLGNKRPLIYLNGGAVIDPTVLHSEAHEFGVPPSGLFVHPNAAIIDENCRDEPESVRNIASTGKGVGLALARKILRETNVAKFRREILDEFCDVREFRWDWSKHRVFVETVQGFSLGINQGFYPYCTSRECTVQQAISDANIPWNKVRKVIMAVRSFPIRVGNTPDGHSGGCYSDQEETTWEALGVEPEYTTVTKRMRRVFTWSRQQFRDAVAANQPSSLFVTFMDYLKESEKQPFMGQLVSDYKDVTGTKPDMLLAAHGPRPEDVILWDLKHA